MARNHVAAAQAQADTLDVLYGSSFKPDPREVAEAHEKLRQAIKLAEVHALLAIADEMRLLREELTA